MEMALRPASDGHLLLPRQLPAERFRRAIIPVAIAAVVAIGFLTALLIHTIDQPNMVKPFFILTGCLILISAFQLASAALMTPRFSQPTLKLTTDRPLLDHSFSISLEIDFYKPVRIDLCRARFRCMENILLHIGRYTQLAARPHTEEVFILAKDEIFAPRQTLLVDEQILLRSADHLPTGKTGWTMYPHYTWQIELEITGDYSSTTIFPLTVSTDQPRAPD